ncbi:MAG: DUF3592 domain-containing protein [Opitutaceae bacterium]|nr:DUF3592 domain-containing protein [Opitutaceae bacterium]
MNFPVGGMLVFFALFWSALTLVFDGLIGYTAVRQLVAQGHTVTEGTILSSSVATSEDSDGTTYRPEVSFRYTVGERELLGTRLSYDQSFASDGEWAHKTVAGLAPGTSVKVYYNPADPADSILRPGLDGGLLFMALFLTPFNAVMVFLWAALARAVHLKWFRPTAGGVRLEATARGTSVRLEGLPALGAGLAAVAATAFASVFIVGFGAGGFHPGSTAIIAAWGVVLGAGIVATFWQMLRNASDRGRLVFDETTGDVVLPPTHGRSAPLALSGTGLTAVHLSHEMTTDSEGSTQTKYILTLVAKGRAPERLTLWSDETKTRGFGTWLAAKLRVPFVEE